MTPSPPAPDKKRLVRVSLDEATTGAASRDIEHGRTIAISMTAGLAASRSAGTRHVRRMGGASALFPCTGSALPILPQSVPLGRLISFLPSRPCGL
jgi:hypothetical protein